MKSLLVLFLLSAPCERVQGNRSDVPLTQEPQHGECPRLVARLSQEILERR
jgi:hypothetical protein